MILKHYEFKIEKLQPGKTLWCCNCKEKSKCKARLITYGKNLVIKNKHHNHPPTFKGDLQDLNSQRVNIYYSNQRNTALIM